MKKVEDRQCRTLIIAPNENNSKRSLMKHTKVIKHTVALLDHDIGFLKCMIGPYSTPKYIFIELYTIDIENVIFDLICAIQTYI